MDGRDLSAVDGPHGLLGLMLTVEREMKSSIERTQDLGRYLASAAKSCPELEEARWQLVADQIDHMITCAIFENEKRNSEGKSRE